jgi:cytochrome P450
MDDAMTVSVSELAADPDGFLKKAHLGRCPFARTDIGPMALTHDAVRGLVQNRKLRPAFTRVLDFAGVPGGVFYDWMSRSALDMDGDEHRVWRRLMSRTFTPHNVEQLRPTLRRESEALAQVLATKTHAEFIGEYARVLPAIGLCELVGVPTGDRALFGGWADTIGLGFNFTLVAARIGEIDAALVALLDYAERLVEARRKEPRDDLITRLIRAADEERVIDSLMVRDAIAGLVFAGHETTKNQLGWMMISILSHAPDEWDRVAREPSRARAVIEEVLRFRSAATSLGRMATEDVELSGIEFPAGTSIVGSLWAANRDPAEFPTPHEFDVDANEGRSHLAFGQGPHHCLGAALARAELQESLIALTSRLELPKLEEGATFLPPFGITGPLALPISYRAR